MVKRYKGESGVVYSIQKMAFGFVSPGGEFFFDGRKWAKIVPHPAAKKSDGNAITTDGKYPLRRQYIKPARVVSAIIKE